MMTMTASSSSRWQQPPTAPSSSSSLVRQPSKLYPDVPKSSNLQPSTAVASSSKSVMASTQPAPTTDAPPADEAERTIYAPLRKASEAVQLAMRADEEAVPSLDVMFAPSNTLSSAAYDDADVYEPYPFRLARSIELPDALFAEMKKPGCRAKQGLLPDLCRAWFVLDDMLLLWDYNHDASRLDRCEHRAGPVDCVGLVKADRSTFAADIDYLLVVCGERAVDVIGVAYSAGSVRLIETGITVAMPSRTRMMQVAGTSSGPTRIFLLGDADNGCIYELRYNVAGWRSYLSRDRLEHYLDNLSTSGTIARYLPYMSAGSAYRQILVDADGLLFALTSSGAIELWDTQTSARVDALNRPLDLARERTYGAQPLLSSARVVALASVSRTESSAVNLVAITDTGARLYLSASLRVQGYYAVGPSRHIILKHIRLPPNDVAEVLGRAKRRDIVGRYLSGVFAFALNGDASATLLFTTMSPVDSVSLGRRRGENQQTPISEVYSAQNRDGGIVYAIAEEPREVTSAETRFASASQLVVSELTSQITSPKPRRFVVLYGDGIQVFTRTTPIETLSRVLADGSGEAITALSGRFLDRPQQLCAMDLAIASGFEQVPELALRHLHEYLRHLTDGKADLMARVALESLDLHASRLLRAIWRSPVTRPGAILNTLDSAISASTLRSIQRPLQALLDEIVLKPATLGLPELSTVDVDPSPNERERLANLRVLLVQTIQALSFVLLLMDFKLPMIVGRAGPQVQTALSGLTYQGLICGRDGREVAKALVTTLINMQTGQQSSIESISNTLQQRCGDFCRSDDVTLYKAWENIRKAKEARSRADRDEYLHDALTLFEQGAGAISLEKARLTCADFRALGYATGAITLPLIVAQRRDPDAQAYRYYEEGQPAGDSRKAVYDMRISYYDVAIEQLKAVDSTHDDCYTVAFRATDGLFLMHLYSWLIAEGRRDQLLELDRDDMVELFLRDRPASAGDPDLLWRFYARRGRHYMAAIALKELADGPSDLPLDRRVEALALATMHAKSSSTAVDERAPVDFVTELEEQAEVAQIQMEIWQAVHGVDEPMRGEALKQLEAGLKTVTELWSEFAEPLQLHEAQLTILKVSDHRDVDLAASVWEELLNVAEGDVFQASADVIERLGRRLYPSDVAFPIDLIVPHLLALGVESAQLPGRVITTLRAARISAVDIWTVITSLRADGTHGFDTEAGTHYLDAELAEFLVGWIRDARGRGEAARDAATLPPAEVDDFLNGWLAEHKEATSVRKVFVDVAKQIRAAF